MRKQDLKLDTMFSRNTVNAFRAPVVLASLSDEFHLARGKVGRGTPIGRSLATGVYPRRGGYPTFYMAIVRSNPVDWDAFIAWAEGGPVPAGHAEYLGAARLAGNWLEGLALHQYHDVPEGLIPTGFQLVQARTRDLTGEWVAVMAARLKTEKVRQEREKLALIERHERQDAFGAVADRMLGSFGLIVKPGKDFRGHTDHTHAQVPLKNLVELLDELEKARDGTD